MHLITINKAYNTKHKVAFFYSTVENRKKEKCPRGGMFALGGAFYPTESQVVPKSTSWP